MAEPDERGRDPDPGQPRDIGPEPSRPADGHGDDTPPEPHWANAANLFTFLRVLLVPVILWLLLREGEADTERWWAFGIFVFAAATDSIDGWVARRYNGVTRWGQLADPIADKLLIIGALASLAWVGDLPWWAVTVIIAREVAVTLLRVVLVRRLGLVMPASVWGKLKTVSQVVAVAAFLVPELAGVVAQRLLDLAVILTVWSGFEYAFRAGRLARDHRSAAATRARVHDDVAAERRRDEEPDR